jgi:hypothetical protein
MFLIRHFVFACDAIAASGWLVETWRTGDESSTEEDVQELNCVGQWETRQLTTDKCLNKCEFHSDRPSPSTLRDISGPTGVHKLVSLSSRVPTLKQQTEQTIFVCFTYKKTPILIESDVDHINYSQKVLTRTIVLLSPIFLYEIHKAYTHRGTR